MSTRKDNKVYVHVLQWHGDRLVLPGIPRKVVASRLLTGGAVAVHQSPERIEVAVPAGNRRELDTIIVLELDGPASELKPRADPRRIR